MYKVISHFTDLQDSGYTYLEGDVYPRDGLSVTKERIAELSGKRNKQKRPLIQKVKEKNRYTRTDINRMPVDELRKLAGETGITGAESMIGADIKKALIDALGL